MGVQEVPEGVRAVPKFMLPPHAVNDRREKIRVVVGRLGNDPVYF